MSEPQTRAVSPIVQFRSDLTRLKDSGELDMLPSNVSFEAFKNAAIVAITDNPAILQCGRESVFKAIRRLAAAGLVPDGQEAAIVPFKGQAQAMPMVRGLIKVARNSAEITSIWSDVVYEGEDFSMWVEDGERKFRHDYDAMNRSGEIVGAYAVAKLKDGTIEVEPMGRPEIEKRRMASANQKGPQPSGIWAQWYSEMARKTVIRALCKRLPMSAEDHRRIMVEDEDNAVRLVNPAPDTGERKMNLAQRLQQAQEEPEPLTGEVMDEHWTDGIDPDDGFPGDDEFDEGREAFEKSVPLTDCPYEADREKAASWIAGWRGAQEAGE